MSKLSPVRAVLALMLMLGLGTGVFVAAASVGGDPSHRRAEPEALGQRPAQTTSRAGERPQITDDKPLSAGQTARPSKGEPKTPVGRRTPSAAGATQSSTPPTATSLAPTLRSGVGQATGSPRTSAAVPSKSPSSAAGRASGSGSPTRSVTPQDNTPPSTTLSQQFPEGDAATFSFSANEPASFACSLDGSAYTACDSPTSYWGLDAGWHTFAVRATDTAGNVDPSPATTRWHASGGPSDDD
ncbi:MAG TPA: hypothetical protein VK204_07280 [Nocardioidaceae bacterium]|nr:hypothetical protein [Nocardioidaceae bacterium]